MAQLSRVHLFRAAAILAFLCALGFGCYGILLLVAAISPDGSPGGNLALGLFGMLFLLACPAVFVVGNIVWKRSRSIQLDSEIR